MVHSFWKFSLPEVSINFRLETVSLQLAGNNAIIGTKKGRPIDLPIFHRFSKPELPAPEIQLKLCAIA
jgi:hypothetical protein